LQSAIASFNGDIGKSIQNTTTSKLTRSIQQPEMFLVAVISEITSDPFLFLNPLDRLVADIVSFISEHKRTPRGRRYPLRR
jgi:hypothetical protein